ncbi:MAG: DUF6371 domain-containing protein [Saprospiraceae bacterium]
MTATENRFTLEKYRSPTSRHTCPQCGKRKEFTRYVDTAGAILFPAHVGKCNREMNCGYHFKPRQYFQEAGIKFERDGNTTAQNFSAYRSHLTAILTTKIAPTPLVLPSYISPDDLERTVCRYEKNNFAKFLFDRFGKEVAEPALHRYRVGTSRHWNEAGATIFWQVDAVGKIRSGKVMLYDSGTGRRNKSDLYKPTWVHKIHPALKSADFHLQQCFFGEHLLPEAPRRAVAIVESEKTAVVASLYFSGNEFLWLAIGGKNFPSPERWEVLRGRRIVLFPDTGLPKGTDTKTPCERWKEKADELRKAGFSIAVSDLLESKASLMERENGSDLADYLLNFELPVHNPTKADHSAQQSPKMPAVSTLPSYRNERHTGRNTGQDFNPPMSAEGYPAAWDLPDYPGGNLAKMVGQNPLVTELTARFDLNFEGVEQLTEEGERAWEQSKARAQQIVARAQSARNFSDQKKHLETTKHRTVKRNKSTTTP